MLGAWDPRSLWAALGQRVFRFEGVFSLTAVPRTSTTAAVAVLLAIPVFVAAAGHLTATRASRFTTG